MWLAHKYSLKAMVKKDQKRQLKKTDDDEGRKRAKISTKKDESEQSKPKGKTVIEEGACDESDDDEEGVVEGKEDDSSSSEEALDSEDELRLDGGGQIQDSDDEDDGIEQVSFEFCEMKEAHFNSLRQFLLVYGPGTFDASGLSDLLISSGQANTVIEVDNNNNEHDAYAFMSLLPLESNKSSKPVKDIMKFCLNAAPTEKKEEFSSILSSPRTRLFVNERMVNLPPQIVPPLYETVLEDAAKTKVKTSSGNKKLVVDNLVIIAPCLNAEDGESMFLKFDEQVLYEKATMAFKVNGGITSATAVQKVGGLTGSVNAHWVMVVPFKRVKETIGEMTSLLMADDDMGEYGEEGAEE